MTLLEKFLTINDHPERIPFDIKNYSPKEIEIAKKCIAIHELEVKKLNKSDFSCRLAYDELKKKNDYFALTKALGFKDPCDGQQALHDVRHLINWSDVKTVVGWLFENGYDVVKPSGN